MATVYLLGFGGLIYCCTISCISHVCFTGHYYRKISTHLRTHHFDTTWSCALTHLDDIHRIADKASVRKTRRKKEKNFRLSVIKQYRVHIYKSSHSTSKWKRGGVRTTKFFYAHALHHHLVLQTLLIHKRCTFVGYR